MSFSLKPKIFFLQIISQIFIFAILFSKAKSQNSITNPQTKNSENFSYENKHTSITKEYLEELKKHVSFEVLDYENHPFKGQKFSEIAKKLKIYDIPMHEIKKEEKEENQKDQKDQKHFHNFSELPLNFDPREKWPKCIHPIENQLQCGSCWAFTTVDVLSDRICIASNNRINVQLSVQHPISCDTNNLACNGGYLSKAISYLITDGTVTRKCQPYTAGYGYVEKCSNKCKGDYIYRKYHASAYRRMHYASQIKHELFNYGPVATGYLVYKDFMSYKGGIYKRTSDYLLGGHAVRIVGWGTDGNTEYWLVANSWGKYWGEDGYFRIAMNNCCNFEYNVYAPYARLTLEDFKENEIIEEIEDELEGKGKDTEKFFDLKMEKEKVKSEIKTELEPKGNLKGNGNENLKNSSDIEKLANEANLI